MSGIPNVKPTGTAPPNLSVTTQSPSTPIPPRRPQGARRRGVAPGLYIANPDNSDDEGQSPSSQKSPVRPSPVTASSSGSGGRIPQVHGTSSSPATRPSSIPTIPLPQPSPLPGGSSFVSTTQLMKPAEATEGASSVPPLPPPQPERHLRRAFTTPFSEAQRSHPESRTASGSTFRDGVPSSPTRALPPLPPISSASPTHQSPPQLHSSNSLPSSGSLHHTDTRPWPFPTHHTSPNDRSMSPDDMLSPSTSEGGSLGVSRLRSGSIQNSKKVLQVTTDNEQFSVVDITGMTTGEGIRDRVFSKMRFRDDDYPTLSLFRTDIGEDPDPTPISSTNLLQLCQTVGDSKATLKFLIVQTSVPGHSAASVIPPPNAADINATPYRSNTRPSIVTDPMPARPSSRHSKEGSMSSASEVHERMSDWSEVGPETEEWSSGNVQIQRATRRNVKAQIQGRRLGSSNGSSRSPLTDRSTENTSPSLPTPPPIAGPAIHHQPSQSTLASPTGAWSHYEELPVSPTAMTHQKGPTSNAVAGSSSQANSGLGLDMDPDMDPESRALIAQLQEEEKREAEQARLRQLAEDELFAQREQHAEKLLWRRMQEEEYATRQQTQQQVKDDEIRAREVAAEEEREARRRASETEQLERSRPQQFAQERRERREHYQNQNRGQWPSGSENDSYDGWTVVGSADGQGTPLPSGRRPSDSHVDTGYPSVGPSSQFTNPIFDQPIYQSPPGQFSPDVPSAYPPNNRRPSGFAADPYHAMSHAQDRLLDPRLQQVTGRATPSRNQPIRRATPGLHPYAYTQGQETESPTAVPSLSIARSMDNLRPYNPPSRPLYQGVPARTSVTPSPGAFPDHRNYSAASYRERNQDGRYPEPTHSAPPRVQPLQLTSSAYEGSVPFPSPRVSNSGTWQRFPEPSPPIQGSYEHGRSQSFHHDRTPPATTSPQTATQPRRPSTYYDNSPPIGVGSGYFDPPPRTRSGSASAMYQGSPFSGEARRASESSVFEVADTQLPYARAETSPEAWRDALSVPGRRDTDTNSIAGTVSSDATVRADGEDTTSTERAHSLRHNLEAMARGEYTGSNSFNESAVDDDDGQEATLFLIDKRTDSPQSLQRSAAVRPTVPKPNLHVDTAAGMTTPVNRGRTLTATPSDSATDSESEVGVQRSKSFARPKDQWNVRPEPELLYEHLQQFFPKIDLDKPIVEAAGLSTPSTPSTESPSRADPFGRPPVHPSRQPPTPTVPDYPEPFKPPPVHPSRGQFNKIEARKSIRGIVDHVRKKTLREGKDAGALKAENAKLERRRSSSMWGHKVVEVTPSKFNGTIPSSIPESPSEGKSPILNWVKGELIGKGSYGRVYIALNVTSGDMMAVKQVELPSTERDRNDRRQLGMVEALKSEIALLKDLYHPNIVAYLGCDTSPEYVSIFLEYVPGGSIASIYRTPNQARFEEPLVKFFTAQILEGLAYLHAKNIWHRDLKGDNILVDAEGVCKISDFGISKQTADAYDSFGQATNMKGSIFWMAPEVVHSANERGYSGKVDIWSLGCVVLEMWSGKRPWGEMEQVAAMFELFKKGAAPPLPKDMRLSDQANDFMYGNCLAIDPSNRPMAVDLLHHPFITEQDRRWTFKTSKIGKAIAANGKKAKVVK